MKERPKTLHITFQDSFTKQILPNIRLAFTYDPVKMLNGYYREWVTDLKPTVYNVMRRTNRLHGKLLTKIYFTY